MAFYRAARDGFRAFLTTIDATEATVLVPAFIGQSSREGSGVMDPIRALGITPRFYAVNDDATADFEDFHQALESARPVAALLIHYYGRADPRATEIAALCRNRGVLLVEDAAHGLFSAMRPDTKVGKVGDVVLYSLHKMLALPYGGMVSYRNPALGVPAAGAYPELATALLSHDLNDLATRRRANFMKALDLLTASPHFGSLFDLVWRQLGGDVPQTVPVRITGADRDAMYFRLNDIGVGVVSLYHTLVHEIGDEYPRSVRLANQVMNLPIHQDLSLDDIATMVKLFEVTLTENAAAYV